MVSRALYIHWPFCLKKCPYCDFNSHVRDGVDVAQWQAALIADMRHEAALACFCGYCRTVDTAAFLRLLAAIPQ